MAECDKPCPNDLKPANDDKPFDPKAWRRKYMRKYMRERRLRIKQQTHKDEAS